MERLDSSAWQPTDPVPISVHGSERLCAAFTQRLATLLPLRNSRFESVCRKRTFVVPVLDLEAVPFALLQTAEGMAREEIHRIP